ncbi:polymorphic toxin-type HINT domain-containing protein [Streptomyces sp. NPDC052396]|uniref:polymorphic toxin-type HINT domain-containing protein n=1 Tax=Streptomyces sp. NPDC052396 TaxID=3365689 RepID=UPI0037CF3BB4
MLAFPRSGPHLGHPFTVPSHDLYLVFTFSFGEGWGDVLSCPKTGAGRSRGRWVRSDADHGSPGDGSSKPIEDVKTGDKVLATDPDTGKATSREVVATFDTRHDKDFTDLTVETERGAASVIATDTHPFWEPTERKWVNAGELRPGSRLRTEKGEFLRVRATRHFVKRQRTHDLTVSGVHTYYVLAGKTPVLVHNVNCGPSLKDLQKDCPRRTVGILDVGNDQLPMISGPGGQAGLLKDLPGRAGANAEHVETHAAAFLRMNPGIRKAVLYIDYPTGMCGTCRSTLPEMLPEGAQLWVVSPQRTEKFVGLPD